jgi:hypothetical protein
MKRFIALIALLSLFALPATAQTDFIISGKVVTYDTTYSTGGGSNLTIPVSTMLKYVGTVKMVDVTTRTERADSVGLWISFSDSVRCAFYVIPKSVHKAASIPDSGAGLLPPATATSNHVQNGAGHVSIPYYKIKAAITDLKSEALEYNVYVRIEKVAGLHTYGTASTGKAAGKMTVQPMRHF